MKKIILTLALAAAIFTAAGQSVQRNGNTFSDAPRIEREKAKADSIGANWQDEDGTYPIHMGSKGGLFYYKVAKSGKHEGEMVKHYIPKAKAVEIKESMGIAVENK